MYVWYYAVNTVVSLSNSVRSVGVFVCFTRVVHVRCIS